MSGFAYWNSAMDSDKSEELKELEWPEHARARGWTCLVLLTGTRPGDQICLVFLGSWFGRYF
jgi:hypothetical protein